MMAIRTVHRKGPAASFKIWDKASDNLAMVAEKALVDKAHMKKYKLLRAYTHALRDHMLLTRRMG
jgi:hypothetical protein